MAEKYHLPSDVYREVSTASNQSSFATYKPSPGASGSKRPAAEPLEQGTTKAAKLTARNDDEIYSEIEMKEEPDMRDKLIVQLRSTVQNQKAEIARLKKDVDEAEEERDEYNIRTHELEARESKRVERERLVETNKHAEMKLAAKNLHTQLKADYQKKEKDMKQNYKEKLAVLIEKHDAKWGKQLDESQTKYQKDVAAYKHEIKTLKADHKEDLKTIKENHKEENKQLKPEHSRAMKDKVNELKAKDKDIFGLKKSLQSMDALIAEKESLANQVQVEKDENERVLNTLKKYHKTHEDVQGQYESRLEHEGQRWQIQHDQAENAKAQLISQQRSILALRGELIYKARKIQALEGQLQAPVAENESSTANASDQTSIDTNNTTAMEIVEENIEAPDS